VADTAAEVIAVLQKWSMTTTRAFIADLEAEGVHVIHRPMTGELCPCGYHMATDSGLCVKCETDREVDRQREADAVEEARLRRENERRINKAKKARERMRRRFLANPRDSDAKELLDAVDEFIALMEEDCESDDFDDEEE
jgi:hypothetical protein